MRNARETRRQSVKIGLPAALLTLLIALLLAVCGGGGSSSSSETGSTSGGDSTSSGGETSSGGKLDVVGYSTPESVYTETLEPAFEESPDGAGVSFSNSFGASGDQSRAVAAGQP